MHIRDVCVCINTHREACTLAPVHYRPLYYNTHVYARSPLAPFRIKREGFSTGTAEDKLLASDFQSSLDKVSEMH